MKTNNNDIPAPLEPKDEYLLKLPIILALYSILHGAMMVTGFIFQDDCPVEPHIPLFLILQGTFGLFSRWIGSIKYFITNKDWFLIFLAMSSLLYVAESIVFVLGTFWVYKVAMPSYNADNINHYCHEGTYLFAFCYISIMYCLIIFSVTFLCCVLFLVSPFGINKVAQTKPWQIVII